MRVVEAQRVFKAQEARGRERCGKQPINWGRYRFRAGTLVSLGPFPALFIHSFFDTTLFSEKFHYHFFSQKVKTRWTGFPPCRQVFNRNYSWAGGHDVLTLHLSLCEPAAHFHGAPQQCYLNMGFSIHNIDVAIVSQPRWRSARWHNYVSHG